MKEGIENNSKPVIPLPKELPLKLSFKIDFESYRKVKKCIFDFMGKYLTTSDLAILDFRSRASMKFTGGDALIDIGVGVLSIDFDEAKRYGFKFDLKSKKLIDAPKYFYQRESSRIIIPSTGDSFPATFYSYDEYYSMTKEKR